MDTEQQLYLISVGNSLVVQWLGIHTLIVDDPGSIPGWGAKIPEATHCGRTKQKTKKPQPTKPKIPQNTSEAFSFFLQPPLISFLGGLMLSVMVGQWKGLAWVWLSENLMRLNYKGSWKQRKVFQSPKIKILQAKKGTLDLVLGFSLFFFLQKNLFIWMLYYFFYFHFHNLLYYFF